MRHRISSPVSFTGRAMPMVDGGALASDRIALDVSESSPFVSTSRNVKSSWWSAQLGSVHVPVLCAKLIASRGRLRLHFLS